MNPVFTMPAAPSRDRHTFGGWSPDGGTMLFQAFENVPLSQSVALFAHWNEIRVTGIDLSQNILVLSEGDAATLQAFVRPANATHYQYIWASSDESVATVDQNGNVMAISSGTATITATTVEGNFVAGCEVVVMLINYPVEQCQ